MAAKTSTRHPYAAIDHRVIDSPAFADLTFSAQALLVLLARQLTRTNNGHLQASCRSSRVREGRGHNDFCDRPALRARCHPTGPGLLADLGRG